MGNNLEPVLESNRRFGNNTKFKRLNSSVIAHR